MKKILLASALIVAFQAQAVSARPVAARPSDPAMDRELSHRASVLTHSFVNSLRLNEGEYVHLQFVHRVLLTNLDAIDAQYASDPATRRAKLVELQGYYEQERLRVLTPAQASRMADRSTRDALPAINTESGGLG